MILTIDSDETPAIWGLSDIAPALEIYPNDLFTTSDGRTVPPGNVLLGDFRHRVIGTVTDGVAVFPQISGIHSTEDALDNQMATYSAYVRVAGREPIPWLEQFPIQPLQNGLLSTSWPRLRIHARATKVRRSNEVYTKQETNSAIDAALLQFRAAMMPSGVAVMIDGAAVVSTEKVHVTSAIMLTAMDAGITGVLRAPQADIGDGEGFVIRSSQEGDSGAVAWMILN